MFHHFFEELGIQDYLVRSMDFTYHANPVASYLTKVVQSGYVRKEGVYIPKLLPPLEFTYTQADLQDKVEVLPQESLENLPIGLDGSRYQWVDLNGEGISGILTDSWYYKVNLGGGILGPIEEIKKRPATGDLSNGQQQLMDLAGDGQLDLVDLGAGGFYERTEDGEDWNQFRPFLSLPNIPWNNPNLRYVSLTGDGHADVLVAEGETLIWYPSLGEKGFGPLERVYLPDDEEKGPKLVFSDGTQSVYFAQMSGDGLSDLFRISNGESCYWPNLGYGKFGAKVTMDNSPVFDTPDLFDPKKIRLIDTDGSGTTDMLYLHHDRVDVFLNQSGNRWSERKSITQFPPIDDLSSVMAVDLFGNGTGCLVWSTPLPGRASRQMSFIRLMGNKKPHLLVSMKNNMGAETYVEYGTSTDFYLADKKAGHPWVTRLPFPVHVVTRVDTYDMISRNLFVTRHEYGDGFFDGIEREFRGFGTCKTLDTEHGPLPLDHALPDATNLDAASHVPPVLTKTWFHTGAYLDRNRISTHFAHEYYYEPGLSEDQRDATLLPDTLLPEGLNAEEEREACRALRGSVLRQEIYALDGSLKEDHPYSVSERNYTIQCIQPCGTNRHAVFFFHPRETLDYHYERNPADPRISHTMTLEVDDFGNVLKSVAIGYGRLNSDPDLSPDDQDKQSATLVTYSENGVTNTIDNVETSPDDDTYRTPLSCETRTYELTGFSIQEDHDRYSFEDFLVLENGKIRTEDGRVQLRFDGEINYENTPSSGFRQRRLIEHVRTLYRSDILDSILELGKMDTLALPGETYRLAFTPGLLSAVYQRKIDPLGPAENLLPDHESVLGTEGGYIRSQDYKILNLFPIDDPDDHWWIPSGKIFYSPDDGASSAQQLMFAQDHFFLPHRFRDPFGSNTIIHYDDFSLLLKETSDPVGNTVTALAMDYRVMQPMMIADPNGNRSAIACDALGMVVGTAVMGKEGEEVGDTLENFDPDPDFDTRIKKHLINPTGILSDPPVHPQSLLQGATTRLVYDFAYHRALQDPTIMEPRSNVVYTMVRETHQSDLKNGEETKIQHSFTYSDGFGREIQKKIQAEPGPVPERDPETGKIGVADGQVTFTDHDVSPRWVGSGWTIFNNKGKPVRQYEPFFSDTHDFDFDAKVGVTPVIFYDPVERVVATLHPNHNYEKVVFDPWRMETWDVNDIVQFPDPSNPTEWVTDPALDPDVGDFFRCLPTSEYRPTWYELRKDAALAEEAWPDSTKRFSEIDAADKAAIHRKTPTIAYFDSLGRTFLTIARNRYQRKEIPQSDPVEETISTRVELDIEGNQREVRDERKNLLGDPEQRVVMRYDYDMLGNRIRQQSMDAGTRWMLGDVTGNPLYGWDNIGRTINHRYDSLRRRTHLWVDENTGSRMLAEFTMYGERHPDSNLSGGNPDPLKLNLRGKVFLQLDGAGVVINCARNPEYETHPNAREFEAYDFKGNLLRSSRRCAKDYWETPDWTDIEEQFCANIDDQDDPTVIEQITLDLLFSDLDTPLESEEFTGSITYDALNRPVTLTAPDGSIISPVFNEANLLESISANLRGAVDSTGLIDNIDYNAKGQREFIEYHNGVKTQYDYDPLTFRLTCLYSTRGTGFPQDCCRSDPECPEYDPENSPCSNPPKDCPKPRGYTCGVQNIHYTYDPAGNITRIRDDAHQTIYFSGSIVQPESDYTYDAIYRLITASGREHMGSAEQPWPTWHDKFRINLPHPCDYNQMRNYTEQYHYDEAGNITKIRHNASNGNGANPNNWIRTLTYSEISPIDSSQRNNQLTKCKVGNQTGTYSYDAHGNMKSMPHLPVMEWDYRDQLISATKSPVSDDCKGCVVYFTYDAAGQRIRKVMKQNDTKIHERFYIGGFEIFRKYNGNSDLTLQRESLHIMDDKQRVALIDTKTIDASVPEDSLPEQLTRYQFGNHLGSAALELDDHGDFISYTEQYAYGNDAVQIMGTLKPRMGGIRPRIPEVSAKRYRYTGKERDEETGLYYHGARYYAPWLGRWCSCDPKEFIDGLNPYTYCRNNPLGLKDNTGTQAGVESRFFAKHPDVAPRVIPTEESERAVSAMAGALYAFGNLAYSAGEQLGDLGIIAFALGLKNVNEKLQIFGISPLFPNYEPQFGSNIGVAAKNGIGTFDFPGLMVNQLLDTPRQALNCAERGDWFGFGNNAFNLYLGARSAAQLSRGIIGAAGNVSIGLLGRAGVDISSIRNLQLKLIAPKAFNEGTLRYSNTENTSYALNSKPPLAVISESEFGIENLATGAPSGSGFTLQLRYLFAGNNVARTVYHELHHVKQYGLFPEESATRYPSYTLNPLEFTQPNSPVGLTGAWNEALNNVPAGPIPQAYGTLTVLNNTLTKNVEPEVTH